MASSTFTSVIKSLFSVSIFRFPLYTFCVVYFNQQTGAPHTVCWSKSFLTTILVYVYNGNPKIETENKDFSTEVKVLEAIKSLKLKNCEG